jgi:hypothetical protein
MSTLPKYLVKKNSRYQCNSPIAHFVPILLFLTSAYFNFWIKSRAFILWTEVLMCLENIVNLSSNYFC